MSDLGRLPTGWIAATLSDLVGNPKDDIVDGPFGSSLKAAEYIDAGIPIVRLQNIARMAFVRSNIRHISEEKARLLKRHSFRSGDIVITKLGDPVGKACIVPVDMPQGVIVADVVRMRARDRLASYVCYGINSPQVARQLATVTKGTTRPRVNLNHIRTLEVPLAPQPEQQRIVDAIESYLTRLDNAVALLERVEENLKRYRASVLKAAVEGRLVPTEAELARREGRSYEPASGLLKRILAERRARWVEDAAEKARAKAEEKARKAGQPWTAKDDAATLEKERAKAAKQYAEPAAPDTTDLPDLPDGWCWATAGQLGVVTGGITKNPTRQTLTCQMQYLRVANVYADELRLDEVESIGVTEDELPRVLLESGDLLVVEGNGSAEQIGRVALWSGAIARCVHQNHLIKVRLVHTRLARYVMGWLLSIAGRDQITRVASSTSGLYTLSISKVESLAVPLCPESEALRIVEAADRFVTLALRTRLSADACRARARRLRQSLLKWAFEGKLVEQDTSDEPASILLERIKAERAAGAPGTRARKRRSAE